MTESKKIVIVGGGITGLTTAFYLKRQLVAEKLPYEISLIEASGRLGGKIKTIRQDGFTIERGPDSFLSRKLPAVELAKELGIDDKLVRNGTGQSYILANNKLHKMPKGTFMGIPTESKGLLFSSLLSIKGKLRTGMDLIKPKGKKLEDQSLGKFFRHRFGNELVDNLIEPLLSGIYAGDMDKISLMATFPHFYQLEQENRSLIKGLQKTLPRKPKRQEKPKGGVFYSFEGGLETFIEALTDHLTDINIQLNKKVDHIEIKTAKYHVLLSSGEVMKADAVVLTSAHQTVPEIFSKYDFFNDLSAVPSTSVANVVLAFDQKALKKDINGTGFVVSRKSDYRITACTWTHRKWPNAAPNGKALLRAYVGKPGDEAIVHLPDEEIIDIVLKDLNKIMKITKKPDFKVVSRWRNAMPQYTIGHVERVNEIRAAMQAELPGAFLAGASYGGVGIPDCIAQGKQAASDVIKFLMR